MTDTNQNSSKRVSSDFLLLHTPSGKGIATACTALLCSVLVLRFRAISHLGELLLGGAERDAGLYLWLIRTNVANLFELPWFETLSFFPYGKSLACLLYTSDAADEE